MAIGKYEFYKLLKDNFPHEATAKQDLLLQYLASFVLEPQEAKEEKVFLLKGYAGTGKTTLMGILVKQLEKIRHKAVLLAPTGRAAKVIGSYAQHPAQTIHRHIYYPKKKSNGGVAFQRKQNKCSHTLFIVDEASMISDNAAESKLFENGSLLHDLMEYVYAGPGCKILFIGDTAQLPPVNLALSPALDPELLAANFDKEVMHIELDEVVRQTSDSGILSNATQLRAQLNAGFYDRFCFDIEGFVDVVRLQDGQEIMDAIGDSYSELGQEETAIVVRSNKRANLYNQQIRSRILFKEEELSAGDFLMVVRNNYFWLDPTSDAGFIANGDIIEVLEIFAIKALYGFRFAEVKVAMVDYPNQPSFETVLLLDTIGAETPSLSYEDSNRLYQEVMKDYAQERSKYKRFLKVKNNKFFNALQVKFSYAITCHKSQGGQWQHIFVEQPYLPNGLDRAYFRWLYTAITRARTCLYLIGFKDDFFD